MLCRGILLRERREHHADRNRFGELPGINIARLHRSGSTPWQSGRDVSAPQVGQHLFERIEEEQEVRVCLFRVNGQWCGDLRHATMLETARTVEHGWR